MKAAVNEVLSGRGVNTVARERGIDRMTLKRYVRKCKLNPKTVCKPNFVTKQIFSTDEEVALADFLVRASKLHYGLSTKATRKLAYDYASANSKRVPDSWKENRCAGKDWLRDFIRRSGNLSLRTPEATSFSRATAWNKQTKEEFFNNLKEARSRHHYPPQNIYNVDETALTTVQKPERVIAGKGCKQVGRMTSAERGMLVTACCCANAIGNVIPPFLVYPRVHFKPSMILGGPPGCVGTANPSGWMSSECFLHWMKHFVNISQSSTLNPVLLLLDNHESHVSYDVLQFASSSGITMVSFPPHTTHKLQPLDVSVYGPLKRYYNTSCDNWMISNARPMTIFDIATISSSAFEKAFTPGNIVAGFKKCGIEPFNPTIFDNNEEFLAASVTDRPATSTDLHSMPGVQVPSPSEPTVEIEPAAEEANEEPPPVLSPSTASTLEELRPFPKAGPRKSASGRRRQKSTILTDTPVRDEARQRQAKKHMDGNNGRASKAKKRLVLNLTSESDKKKFKRSGISLRPTDHSAPVAAPCSTDHIMSVTSLSKEVHKCSRPDIGANPNKGVRSQLSKKSSTVTKAMLRKQKSDEVVMTTKQKTAKKNGAPQRGSVSGVGLSSNRNTAGPLVIRKPVWMQQQHVDAPQQPSTSNSGLMMQSSSGTIIDGTGDSIFFSLQEVKFVA